MKHVSILVPKGKVALSTIEGPYNMFTRLNEFLAARGQEPAFNIQLVGVTSNGQVYDRLFTVRPDVVCEDVRKTDLIIIPAVNGDMQEVIELNKEFFPWIRTMYHDGAEVASLCVGAFILAATGLLDGRKCSTHWLSANDFRDMFPHVNLVDDQIVTEESGVYTSGGASSFWNLMLYLAEKYTDRQMAIQVAKFFALEIDRKTQSSFIIFKGQRKHQDEDVKKAQEFIEQNFQEKITVDQLASMFAVGRRSLERRFKKATNNTVSEYIQRVKIEAAKKDFELSMKNINEVMYEVGYSDIKAFRTTFKKITGLSPIEYKNKYNKQVA